ncbi:hypothetical protein T492DRAFT_1018063 [Pavlovales sp. CCMP2436]|nr:hypothetical protein T492DRAFT_1018063 [Pavlovales sp. CCMP2436]
MWTADALEEQASRECGRRIDLRCCAEVTQALAAQKADASEGQAEKANLPVLVRLAAEGNLLAAIALARRRLVELLMHYYKLRKNAVPEGPGLHVCFTRISESSCVSGRMYYEESGRMVSPLALPKNDILVRSPALAASSRSIAAHCAAGVPPAGKAHVAVLDRTFSREQAAAATAAKAETEEQLNCTPPPSGSLGGSESDFALPTGVHLATIERMLPCSVAQCIVRVNGAACTLEAHWGYSRHQAENTPVVLLAVGASLRAEPALGEHIEADGAISGALRPYPADRVFLVSKYVAFDGSESGNATLDEAARARFACTHPPAGALVLRPSRLLRFNLRDCVRARPGCMLVCVDYKNAELAIAASMSGDHNLCSALDAGDDPFRLIARQLRRKGKDLPIGDEERARAKQMFYAVLYGGGSPKVEQRFFECFPGVQALIDALRAKGAEEGGAVHTVAGRRRVFTAEERKDARLFRRRALNAVCQGSVADLLKISMVANNGLEARLQQTVAPSVRVRLLMQLHDELVYEVGPAALPTFRSSSDHASERDPAEDILRVAIAGISEGMTEAGRSVGLRVPLRTTVKVGATWGSAQPLVP